MPDNRFRRYAAYIKAHHILVPPEAEPPPFGDINKVLALFRDERLQEWATEWPSFGDDPQTVRATAIRLARAGRPEDLIRLVEALSKPPPVVKRGRGRPKMSRSARVQASPIHRAAGMVPFTEFILRELYPKQSEKRIHDRAILVVERIWRDERVTEEKLINYLDRHRGDRRRLVYSPFIFDFHEQQIVPAESVYAVFEAKQTINATLVQYAQKKTATVRNLYRTSLAIPTANGMAPPKKPGHIIGGILTFESDWKPALGAPLLAALKQGTGDAHLDMGCIAAHGTFTCDADKLHTVIPKGKPATAFLFELIARLQDLATVPMIDVRAYAKWLSE